MRYIGGKTLLLDKISNAINENCSSIHSIMDIFAGSGVVSSYLVQNGFQIISNDILYFSYVIQRCIIGISKIPSFDKLKEIGIFAPLDYLNSLTINKTDFDIQKCFIYQNYSLGGSSRMYFREDNALKIDIIRLTIEQWHLDGYINDDEYFYLLASLIYAVPYVANITGVYAAYLKFWDKRTYNRIVLKEIPLSLNNQNNYCYNCDYTALLKIKADLLYADPPYNQREYAPNYHLLETIARYDYPKIKGVTGMREYSQMKSKFCSKKTVEEAFETLIRDTSCNNILISYNNEGLITTTRLSEICKDYAINDSFKLYEFDYRRYKNKIPNETEGLKEQLYFLRRR